MKKISIIIPAFNSARYIRRCLDSLLCQRGAELEIIVVNDGSTDNTLEILEEYRDKIVLKDIKNDGVSNARNAGLEAATGNFVMFLDSDDYFVEGTIEKIVAKQAEHNADIMKFRYKWVFMDGTEETPLYQIDVENYFEKAAFKKSVYPLFIKGICLNSVCFSMFKLEVVKDIRFRPDMKTAEDAVFSLKAFTKAQSVHFLTDIFYAYYQTKEGLTGTGLSVKQKYKDNFIFAFETIKLLKQWKMNSVFVKFQVLMRPILLTFDKIKRLRKGNRL